MANLQKVRQDFIFNYPLKHKVVRDLRIVTEYVGDLEIIGTGTLDKNFSRMEADERYTVDIDFVKWNGTDIQPVLDMMHQMDEIHEAAVRYFADLVEATIREREGVHA